MSYPLEKAVYALIVAFIIGAVICPILIPVLHKLKYGQTEREDGPESHLKKSGTPTMGGIAILIAFAVSAFIFGGNEDGIAVILITLGFGIVGFIDDYIKVVKKRSLGLRAYQKIILQTVFTVAFAYYLYKADPVNATKIYIPFTNGYMLDLKFIYWPFLYFVMLGTVNGVNLTDGLDGLAGGVTMIVAVFFVIMSWISGSAMPPEVSAAAVGALLAFLLFNAYPARVFMGDKKTGKRVFKMAPIHHHFELCGWSETKVVTVFYIITAIMCLIAYLGCNGMFL